MTSLFLTILLLSAQIQAQPTIIFDKNISLGYGTYLNETIQTSDDGFAMLFQGAKQKYWITRLSAEGDSLWTKALPDSVKGRYWTMAETPDGEYLLLGGTKSTYGYHRQTSTPDTRKEQAYFTRISPTGNFISETPLGDTKYHFPRRLISSETGMWAMFMDHGDSIESDLFFPAFCPRIQIVHFDLTGVISCSDSLILPRERTWGTPKINPLVFHSEPYSDKLILGITLDISPPFRIDPYHPPEEIYQPGGVPYLGLLDSLGRDTLDIELITFDPKSGERQVDSIRHYEEFIGKELDGICKLNENFWFYSDSNSATSIENRLIQQPKNNRLVSETNFIINDWDSTGSLIKRSVVDFGFDYEKYSYFTVEYFQKLFNNTFLISGRLYKRGHPYMYFVASLDRNGVNWFWEYESSPYSLLLRDVIIKDSEMISVHVCYKDNEDGGAMLKIIKLQLPD